MPHNKINLAVQTSTAWPDLFNITSGLDGLEGKVVGGGNEGAIYFEGKYISSTAITLSNYNNLPIGSKIEDHQAKKTLYKTGATTWYYDAWTLVT